MGNNRKCWKTADNADTAEQPIIHVGASTYSLQNATEEEIEKGNACLSEWSVELEYEVQVSGPGIPRAYLDTRTKSQSVSFDELIFRGGECIGIYHAELIMLFDDEGTHRQRKFIGEFITGPDRTHCAYDYYILKRIQA